MKKEIQELKEEIRKLRQELELLKIQSAGSNHYHYYTLPQPIPQPLPYTPYIPYYGQTSGNSQTIRPFQMS
jgi:hypothetical protein